MGGAKTIVVSGEVVADTLSAAADRPERVRGLILAGLDAKVLSVAEWLSDEARAYTEQARARRGTPAKADLARAAMLAELAEDVREAWRTYAAERADRQPCAFCQANGTLWAGRKSIPCPRCQGRGTCEV